MKENLNRKLETLAKKARASAPKPSPRVAHPSSLHQVIKTKQQAEILMRSLREA